MSKLFSQFDSSEPDSGISASLEHAYLISRGVEVAIRVARESAVRREMGSAVADGVCVSDADSLLALAGSAAALLGDRLESLANNEHFNG